MMLYSFGHPMQLCCTLLYSRVGSIEAIFQPHSFVDQAEEVFFANCLFLLFLVSARLLVLQSFKMDFGEESEVKVSSRDGEGEFRVFRIFLKKCSIVLYEMLHSFGHPSVKHD